MAPCLATAAPSLSSPRNPDNPPDTTPPPPSSETQNRADPAPLARSCHRPPPASARSPSTPVSGSHACAAPIASAFSGSSRESEEVGILGGFLESDEFSSGKCPSLCFQQ